MPSAPVAAQPSRDGCQDNSNAGSGAVELHCRARTLLRQRRDQITLQPDHLGGDRWELGRLTLYAGAESAVPASSPFRFLLVQTRTGPLLSQFVSTVAVHGSISPTPRGIDQ
jgi:hypothetical protein